MKSVIICIKNTIYKFVTRLDLSFEIDKMGIYQIKKTKSLYLFFEVRKFDIVRVNIIMHLDKFLFGRKFTLKN
jgi:hypothetical protein